MELMKEKFAKLLLGEDMSGSGKGVPSALAVSNAITNLAGSYTRQICPSLWKERILGAKCNLGTRKRLQ